MDQKPLPVASGHYQGYLIEIFDGDICDNVLNGMDQKQACIIAFYDKIKRALGLTVNTEDDVLDFNYYGSRIR